MEVYSNFPFFRNLNQGDFENHPDLDAIISIFVLVFWFISVSLF